MKYGTNWTVRALSGLVAAAAMGVFGSSSVAQVSTISVDSRVVIVPQVRMTPRRVPTAYVENVGLEISIKDQVSTTVMEMSVRNPSGAAQEAQFLIPVADGVAVRSLQYDGVGPEPTARVLLRDEARRIYASIVSSMRDPALVEFVGYNLIQTSAFPIPAGGVQKVTLTMESMLPADGERVDYFLPRSESAGLGSTRWEVRATIEDARGIATVFSPSHSITSTREGSNKVIVRATESVESGAARGSVRLSYVRNPSKNEGFASTLIAYPDPTMSEIGGGYFMLVGSLPSGMAEDRVPLKREVVLVLDRSGSMRGEKFDQAKSAAIQVVEGLEDGETFNIIDYSDSIASFAATPVVKDKESASKAREYIAGLKSGGGTNILDALLEATRPTPADHFVPIVLFLTDGLPTIGERSEIKIREKVEASNVAKRRIFTFGVGSDVNSPLLNAIATKSRAASTFVLSNEDVEAKVSQVFRRLAGPLLAEPKLTALGADGSPVTTRLREVMPMNLPDVFEGDQVIVLGQFMGGKEPVRFRLEGKAGDRMVSYDFKGEVSSASVRNGYVPRLWASSKIGMLLDEIRQAGAGEVDQERMKEIVDEVVALSTKFGILTEYTAFLATEPERVAFDRDGLRANVEYTYRNLESRNLDRSGNAGINQEENLKKLGQSFALGAAAAPAAQEVAGKQWYYDENMSIRQVNTVQNVSDYTLFYRNNVWVDSRILDKETLKPDEVVEFGSEAYMTLAMDLAAQNRQAVLAQEGDVLLLWNTRRVLVRGPRTTAPTGEK